MSEARRTIILKVDCEKPERKKIELAADVIRRGGLVAFPTETVYGLGANALNSEAVRNIYLAKMRPMDNPIIVHVARREDVYRLAIEVPEEAEKLMRYFWPGPLTLILKASEIVPRITTGGLDTVAIRMPRHKVALALIEASGTPIAAPSANLAGRPSPTMAEHVIQDLYGRIDVILDAGPTNIGVESTVIDLTFNPPQILRPGGVTYEELKSVLGKVRVHPAAVSKSEVHIEKARSPGLKYRHYAPKAETIVVEGEFDAIVKKVMELARKHIGEGKRVGILATDESLREYGLGVVKSMGSRSDLSSIAKNLFKLLREFDDEGVDIIIAEGLPQDGLGLAVMNRLRKAAGYNIIEAK
ncbi:MAG: L-threonylcarbamoyladenylate synthase [Candidatus Bathyarchaeota archaeon]|nr:L-threonylcarbamoyladenylate synthase [Candidatus Bathyarchaeota archaeon]